jgi:hypothetical protein
MAIARAKLVDVSFARWYHCISRCVRMAFLLGEGDDDRREWLENRLEELADIFAVAVGGFFMMNGAGRIYWPALSPGKGVDLGGAGWDLRAAGFKRPELADWDGEALRRSFVWPILCGQRREAEGNRRTPRCAASGQLGGMSHSMTASWIADRITSQSRCRRSITPRGQSSRLARPS